MANGFKRNKFRKEYIPIAIAIGVLIILIIALIITIINKPVKKVSDNTEGGVTIKEKVIPANSCEGINELMNQVKQIEANYSVEEVEVDGFFDLDDPEQNLHTELIKVIKLTISNIPDNVELVITSDQDNDVDKFTKNEEKQTFEKIYMDTAYLRVVTIKVYSKLDSCKDIVLREFDFTLPRWNETSKMPVCQDKNYYSEEVCKPFIFEPFDGKSDTQRAKERIAEVNREKNKNTTQEEKERTSKIKYIVVGIVIVGITTIVGVISMNKKGRKKNEK